MRPDPEVESLQVKVAFLERHVEELDGVIRDLFDTVNALRSEVTTLRETVESEGLTGTGHERPPHY